MTREFIVECQLKGSEDWKRWCGFQKESEARSELVSQFDSQKGFNWRLVVTTKTILATPRDPK